MPNYSVGTFPSSIKICSAKVEKGRIEMRDALISDLPKDAPDWC